MCYKSDPFPIRRGVLQGCIFSPILFVLCLKILFVLCLNSVWKRTSPGQGWQILPGWLLDVLSYADDIGMVIQTTLESQNRLQSFSDINSETLTMCINPPKTVRMPITPKITVTKITEANINADEETFRHPCDICHRRFDTTRGVSIHKSKNNCVASSTAVIKPRRNQRANKIIEAKKRAIKVEAQAKITLNGEFISNVEIF